MLEKLAGRRIFKDPLLQKRMEEEGFVLLDLFNEKEVEFIRNIYSENLPSEKFEGFYTTHWLKSEAYRYKIDSLLRPFLTERLKDIFFDYKMLYAYFMVKHPGENSIFHVHQDWTQVDESKYTGVTFWAPLVAIDKYNGAFHIVPKSHLFPPIIRGAYLPSPFGDLCDYIENNMVVPVYMNVGQGLFFDQRIWHFSPPNLSEQSRVAVGMVQIPQEAQLIHYYNRNNIEAVELYEGNDNMLLDYAFGDEPKEKKLKFIKYYKVDQPFFSKKYFSQKNIFKKLFTFWRK